MFPSINNDNKISCQKVAGINKSDILIKYDGLEFGVSIKSGSGNSVHQEPLNDFISYLDSSFDDITPEIKRNIKLFIWGDGTEDGTGDKSSRVSGPDFKEQNLPKINLIQDFFNLHKKKLVERFLVEGFISDRKCDFIYYGTKEGGFIKKSDKVVEWVSNQPHNPRKVISIGALSFQAWNRAIKDGSKSEHKRGVVQAKWGQIGTDLSRVDD